MSVASTVVGGVVSGWIAGSFDDITLLIPMEDAGARVDADELEPSAAGGLELGMLRWDGELWPAYRLDRELVPFAWEPEPTSPSSGVSPSPQPSTSTTRSTSGATRRRSCCSRSG